MYSWQVTHPHRSMIVALLCLLLAGCDPFARSDEKIVPDGDGPKVALLTAERHLPRTATGIHVATTGFPDRMMIARFEAPAADARTFADKMLGGSGKPCRSGHLAGDGAWWPGGEIAWWPKASSPEAVCREDMVTHDDARLPISVEVMPHGAQGTVLVLTSRT